VNDIEVKECDNLIHLYVSGKPCPYTITKIEAYKLFRQLKNILINDEDSENEQEELTPCDFFESACERIKDIDPAEEDLEFEFYQELLNAYKNYRIKHENYPFSSDEMPSK